MSVHLISPMYDKLKMLNENIRHSNLDFCVFLDLASGTFSIGSQQ